jgi:hypothetical protein
MILDNQQVLPLVNAARLTARSTSWKVCLSSMRVAILLFAVVTPTCAQDPTFPTPTIPLWEKSAPGALGNEDRDQPTLTLYPTFRETIGTAVIIAPAALIRGWPRTSKGGRWRAVQRHRRHRVHF